jgi:hypothetical protein
MKVKEIKKTVYETIDGQQFDIESEAKEHEAEILSDYITIEAAATVLKKHCEKTMDCSDCPFENKIHYECKLKRDMPESWDI